MNQNTLCPSCGGQVAPFDFVCDYCGTVLFNHLKTTDNPNDSISFEDGMGIVKQNLDALHDIPKPELGKSIKSALRILVALFTLGIVLIFWHRPKKRFNKLVYNKLKQIIIRNIEFLKISSKGSQDLMSRIKVFENELNTVDKQVRNGLLTKNILIFSSLTFYLLWLVYVVNQEPKSYSTYQVTAYDSLASGNLRKLIQIKPDTFVIKHRNTGVKWEIDVKLKLSRIETIPVEKTKFNVHFILTDEKGIPIEGFKKGELNNESKSLFRSKIIHQDQDESYYRFQFDYMFDFPDYMDTIPVHAIKFIIQADTINAGY